MNGDMRPNILIFMTDQEQAQVCEPGHPCRTPHADRLAAEGIQFRQAYTPSAHCCPSRATFMTGLYPSRHGVWNNVLNSSAFHTGINPGIPMFSEVLRAAGYELAYAGKWHVSGVEHPRDRGWNQYFSTCLPGDFHGVRWADWQRTMRQFDRKTPRRRGELIQPGIRRYPLYGTRSPDPQCDPFDPGDLRKVQAGIHALRDLAAQEKPWCLFVGIDAPHDPFILPAHYARMYDPADVDLPPNFHDDLSDKPCVYQRMRRFWDQLGEDETREAIAHYWGACTMADDLLGMILDALDQTGQAENTLVIFLADHGEAAGAHGLFMKGFAAFEECYRVPCIMRWQRGILQPGRVVDEFITLADFAPTLVELAGAAAQPASGRSLLPFLHGEQPANWPGEVCSQFNGIELYFSQRFVRTRDWMYVYNGSDTDELYNLRSDPQCLHNLANDDRCAEVIQDLCTRMWHKAQAENDCILYTLSVSPPYGP